MMPHLLMSVNVVRISTSSAFAVNAGLRVHVTGASLTAARQLARRSRGIPAAASSPLLIVRVVAVVGAADAVTGAIIMTNAVINIVG